MILAHVATGSLGLGPLGLVAVVLVAVTPIGLYLAKKYRGVPDTRTELVIWAVVTLVFWVLIAIDLDVAAKGPGAVLVIAVLWIGGVFGSYLQQRGRGRL